VNVLII